MVCCCCRGGGWVGQERLAKLSATTTGGKQAGVGVVGVNAGKNKATELAQDDYSKGGSVGQGGR